MHDNTRKYGSIDNTVAPDTELTDRLRPAEAQT